MLNLRIYHCVRQHGFYHFIHVIIWLERPVCRSLYSIFIYELVLIILVRVELILVLRKRPIEADIASSLMSELKRTFRFLLRNPPEDQQRPLCLLQEFRVFFDEGVSNVNFPGKVNLLFLRLVKHDVTNIFYIVKLLLLEA